MRTMTAEQSKALAEARKRTSDQLAKEVITLGKGWIITRPDSLNWELSKDGKHRGYFASLRGAMEGCVRKATSDGLSGEISDVVRRISDVEAWVKSASFGCVQ